MAQVQPLPIVGRKEREAAVKRLICDLLSWSESEYAEYQYYTGTNYLEHYIPDDPQGAEMLTRSRIFWSWWRNLWAARDRAFINGSTLPVLTIDRRTQYITIHDAARLASDIYPGRVVLDCSYAEMIGKLFDAEITAR